MCVCGLCSLKSSKNIFHIFYFRHPWSHFFFLFPLLSKMSFRALKSTRDILQQLRTGPGATALPSNINKIALTFAIKGKNESASARYMNTVYKEQ